MKIKNILHAAALRFCLVALAMSAVSLAYAAAPEVSGKGALDEAKLKEITSLSISADDFKEGQLEDESYYDNDKWYNLKKREARVQLADAFPDVYSFNWTSSYGITFKLPANKDFKLTVNYYCGDDSRGIRVYPGTDNTGGFTRKGKTDNTTKYENIEFGLEGGKMWTITGLTGGSVYLHSITVEEVIYPSSTFPSNINAINDNTFWYHNGGYGFSMRGESGSFYRYFVNQILAPYAPTSGNMISINGVKNFDSYEIKPGDAIGFKLAPYNDEYRIKLYYYSDGAPAVLVSGTDVSSAKTELTYETDITIKDNGRVDTKTRMKTYHVTPSDNTVYWVKNNSTDGQSLYLGGFEILKKNEGDPTGEFTGSWYVEDQAADLKNSNDNNKVVGSIAQSHDGVVTGIVTMPINDYAISGKKSVMMNWGSKIGLNIPAGATLSFTYTADDDNSGIAINKDGYTISLSTDADATSNYNKFSNYKGEVSYTNETGSTETIWIQGMSANYAYFSGFEVTQPGDETPSIDKVVPISEDYVWYPVEGQKLFGNETFSDAGKTVFVYKDFSAYDKNKTLIYNTKQGNTQYKLHGKDMVGYRVGKSSNVNTQIGFKIAAYKKGVINCYYPASGNVDYFALYQSNNPTSLGNALTRDKGSMGNNVNYTQYKFDTSDGEKTFWLKAGNDNVWFGGFEVLFEEDSTGPRWLQNNYPYKVEGNETIENALGDDTYTAIQTGGEAVAGPSMIIRQPAADNTVMLFKRNDVRNSILIRVNDESRYLNVKGYLDGATIRIYKGAPSSSNTEYAEVTGSGVIDKTVSIASLGGKKGDLYYITSDDAAGAYLTSVTPKDGNFTTLQPTDVNYIYKVNSELSSGVQNSGDCNGRIMFVDPNNSARIDNNDKAKMNVLGTDVNPVTIDNGTDFFAVKVDQGPNGVKTGYVKVYFKGTKDDEYKISHKMEELPLDEPMYAGGNSTYDPATQTITFEAGSGNRGWWYGNGGDAKNLSAYNKINIEVEAVSGDTEGLQLVVQDTNGKTIAIKYDSTNRRFLGDLTGDIDLSMISQIYIQDWRTQSKGSTVKIKSARLMKKPVMIATDNDTDPTNGYTEVFGGKIYDMADGYVYEYPFDLNKVTPPQHIWITGAGEGTLNIAAIEVLYDSNHAKVVDWYVNKDTKMIVGSDDPSFKMQFNGETLEYPEGYDEYVTFYMSSGRTANVSFIMPEAVREVYDWEKALANTSYEVDGSGYVIENNDLKTSYGKHTIESKVINNASVSSVTMNKGTMTYDRNKAQKATMNSLPSSGGLYKWYSYSYDFPSNEINDNYWAGVEIKATQKVDGEGDTVDKNGNITSKGKTDDVGGKLGEWRIYMRFVSFKAPEAEKLDNSNIVTVTGYQKDKYNNDYDIYYTIDSSEPENYGVLSDTDKQRSVTEKYTSDGVDVTDMNCILKAAQYIDTPFAFYDDISRGKDSSISNVLKVVSRDLEIINEIDQVVYVKDKTLTDKQLFNVQKGGYMLTIPTGEVDRNTKGWQDGFYQDKDGNYKDKNGKLIDKDGYFINEDGKYVDKDGNEVSEDNKVKSTGLIYYYDQPYNENPFMYLTLGGKDHPYLRGNVFEVCGNNWKASNDGGLKTYLDSYQFKMDVDGVTNPAGWGSDSQQQNPVTECNYFVGGADTEDGGMFLQPIGGMMLRFEPEYDGVITVWLRQNGCLDNNSQENGTFTRRPVYIMDENGRIMRRSKIRPTAQHYMGINGTWAINSSVCEERSQVEHTWLYEVAKQAFANHPVYAGRFNDPEFPNRWVDHGQEAHNGHILYGWWYRGFNLDATRSTITSAAHVSRYEYMEPQLLYRSDKIYNMEINRLGLAPQFAKYGYELPNFQYVRYRIPVKAGKTYYIAGRGTKNGFSAIRFDALKPNTNLSENAMEDLRYTDNPEVVENSNEESDDYLKISYNWDNNGKRDYKDKTSKSEYDLTGKSETDVKMQYDKELTTLIISDTGTDNGEAINAHVYDKDGKKVGMDKDGLGNLVGKTVNFELNRTFRAYNWHPIILPFSLSETRVEQYFGEGTVILYLDPYAHTVNNQVDETTGKSWTSAVSPALEGTKLSFTYHRYQMLYANTPAFICPTFTWSDDKKKSPATNKVKPNVENGAVTSITFKRVTLDGSNSRNFLSDGRIGYAISNDYEVVGSYDQTEHNGDIYYVNNTNPTGGKDGNKAQLVHSNGNPVTMKGTRVWIRPRAGVVNAAPILTVGSKGFSDFEEDSESAGISDIVADDYTIEGYDVNDDSVYDLLGRKVGRGSLDGLLKGVYIFHGKKVYVK